MGTANKSKASTISIVGYIVWFVVLVRLLFIATNDQPTGFAEAFGIHLGVGLSLLALLGIPYFIVRRRAQRLGESFSWFLVMMWTTIIALLLAVGGFYGRMHMATQSPSLRKQSNDGEQVPSLQSATTDQASQETQRTPDPEEGVWLCTGSSNQLVRLFLFPKSAVYMSVESDKWTLMQDLSWRSQSTVSNQSGNYLAVQLLTTTKASITWPAGESTSCTRESVQVLPTPEAPSSNSSSPTYSVPKPPPGFVLDDPTAAGATDVAGWTQESTQSTEAGPWLAHSPAGTRYFRDKDGIIHRVFPPNVRPDAASADATIVANSTITVP